MKNVSWRQFVGFLHHRAGSDHHPLKSCMYDVYEGSDYILTAGPQYYQNPSTTTEVNEFMAHGWRDPFVIWILLEASQNYWPPKNDWTTKHISQICGIFGSQILRYRHASLLFGQHSWHSTMVVPLIVQLSPTNTGRPGRWCQELEGDPVYICNRIHHVRHGTLCYTQGFSNFNSMQVSVSMMCLGLYQSPISSASTCYSAPVWNPHSKNENTLTWSADPVHWNPALGRVKTIQKNFTPTGSRNRALRHVAQYFFHDSPDVCGLHEKVVTVKFTPDALKNTPQN